MGTTELLILGGAGVVGMVAALYAWVQNAPVPPTALRCVNCRRLARRGRVKDLVAAALALAWFVTLFVKLR